MAMLTGPTESQENSIVRNSEGRKKALLILGMHRSGTSSVAGSMAVLGAKAPATPLGPAGDNPRGFFESRVIAALNDRVLAAVGSRWDDWQSVTESFGEGAWRN